MISCLASSPRVTSLHTMCTVPPKTVFTVHHNVKQNFDNISLCAWWIARFLYSSFKKFQPKCFNRAKNLQLLAILFWKVTSHCFYWWWSYKIRLSMSCHSKKRTTVNILEIVTISKGATLRKDIRKYFRELSFDLNLWKKFITDNCIPFI